MFWKTAATVICFSVSYIYSHPIICELSNTSSLEQDSTCTDVSNSNYTRYDVEGSETKTTSNSNSSFEMIDLLLEDLLILVNQTGVSDVIDEVLSDQVLSEIEKDISELDHKNSPQVDPKALLSIVSRLSLSRRPKLAFKPGHIAVSSTDREHRDSFVRKWQVIVTSFMRMCRKRRLSPHTRHVLKIGIIHILRIVAAASPGGLSMMNHYMY